MDFGPWLWAGCQAAGSRLLYNRNTQNSAWPFLEFHTSDFPLTRDSHPEFDVEFSNDNDLSTKII